MKNGPPRHQGQMPTCGTVMFKILGQVGRGGPPRPAPGRHPPFLRPAQTFFFPTAIHPHRPKPDSLIYMSQQLAYVIITLTRLQVPHRRHFEAASSPAPARPVGLRMFAPAANCEGNAQTSSPPRDSQDRKVQELLQQSSSKASRPILRPVSVAAS